ncbi:hypothetical protein [uncultured Roseobacter sp.]|uniref:hypothetical protein n=1 Tax=uncultured Roseobacter sp. TaxID=114847 RepID=UPI00261414EB|nr:hypothetical protein [uncultured Roseobacter sp.]
MGNAKYTLEKVAYSSVVGQSVMVINQDGACVAQLSVMVPNPSFDYRDTAEAVADYICNSKQKKDALDFLASEGQHCDAIDAAVKDTWERAAKIADLYHAKALERVDLFQGTETEEWHEHTASTAGSVAAAIRAEGGDV